MVVLAVVDVVAVMLLVVVLVAIVILLVVTLAIAQCDLVMGAGDAQMPRLTSSCCDIKSTCQSSSTSRDTDIFMNSANTQHDRVTAVAHTPRPAAVGGISRQPVDCAKLKQVYEKARHYGEKSGRLSGSGLDRADLSLMLPPESTV